MKYHKLEPKIVILLALFLSTPVFAAEEIITFGYGAQMHDLLRAVVSMTGSMNDLMIKSAMIIGLLLTMWRLSASGRDVTGPLIKFTVMSVFIANVFWVQKGEFIVRDRTSNYVSPVVLNLPYGIGQTFSIFSNLEDRLAAGFESAFSTPNSISYQKAGLGFMMSAHLGMDSITATDPTLTQTFTEYLDNCLLNSAAMGNLNINSIQTSTDLMNALAVNEAWLTPIYGGSTYTSGQVVQCTDAWTEIKSRIPADAAQSVGYFAKSFGQLSAADVSSKLGDVATTLFGDASISSVAYINQMALKNMFDSGLEAVAASTASDLSAVATAQATTQSMTKASWTQAGLQAKQTLPMQKAFLTMISVVMLMLMSLYSIAMVDFSGITEMFKLLFTYAIWTPLAVVLNFLTYSTLESVVGSMSGNALPTIYNSGAISDKTSMYLAFMGYAISIITGMSFFLISKNGTSFVQQVTSAGMSASTLKAAELGQGLGNFGHGNVSIQNSQIGNSAKYGNSVYGQDIAAQTNGSSASFSGGVFRTEDNSRISNAHKSNDGGLEFSLDQNGRLNSANIKELQLSGSSQNTQALSKGIKESQTIQENIEAAHAISIMQKVGKGATQSTIQAEAEKHGMDVQSATEFARTMKEAEAKATKEAESTKNSHINQSDTKTGVQGEVGYSGQFGGIKGTASKTNTALEQNNAENSKSAEKSQSFENAFAKNVKDAVTRHDGFEKSIQNSLASTVSKTDESSNGDTYKRAQAWAEAKAIEASLTDMQTKSLNRSIDMETQVLQQLMTNHGEDRGNVGSKAEFLSKVRNDIMNGGKIYGAEIDAIQKQLSSTGGYDVKDFGGLEERLKGVEGQIAKEKLGLESVLQAKDLETKTTYANTNPSFVGTGPSSSLTGMASSVVNQVSPSSTGVDTGFADVHADAGYITNGVNGINNTGIVGVAGSAGNTIGSLAGSFYPVDNLQTGNGYMNTGNWISNLPSSQMSPTTRAELTNIATKRKVGAGDETF